MSTIYLSGIEAPSDYAILSQAGCHAILTSYMHMRKRKKGKGNAKSLVQVRREENPDIKNFVDSGVYTLRMDPDYLRNKGESERDYIDSYIEFLYDNAEYITCAANYDRWFDDKENTEYADELFKKFEVDTGVPIVYIWHYEYGIPMWEKMCQEHKYVGFNSFDAAQPGVNQAALLATARRYGTWVHGFAITDTDTLGRDLFYSVDSSTVLMGAKYGRTMVWTGAEFKQFDGDNKPRRNQYRNHFIQKGVDWDLIERDNNGERSPEIRAECIKMNAISWMDYQDFVYKRIEPRAYWLKLQETIERVPDVDQLTKHEILSFYKDIEYSVVGGEKDDVKQLRNELIALFAFAWGDQGWIEALTEDEVKEWAVFFYGPDVLFDSSDRTKLVGKCRAYAVDVLAPAPKDTAFKRNHETIKPTLGRPKARVKMEDLPRDVEDEEEVDLPEPVENFTEQEDFERSLRDDEQGFKPPQPSNDLNAEIAQTGKYPAFIQGFEDETHKLRAYMLVDTCRRVNDLTVKVRIAKLKRAKEGELKDLKKQWRAAVAEQKFLCKMIPVKERKEIIKWVEDNEGAVETNEAKALSVPKQTLTTERAREIGKLGGAPAGNKNALKNGLYSKKLPSLVCDACPIAGQCHLFRAGHVCAYDREFKKLKVTTVEEAKDALLGIVNHDMERLQRQLLFETVQGGIANTDNTKLINDTFARVERVKQIMEGGSVSKTSLTETRTVSGPEHLLAKLFSSATARSAEAKSIDVEAERIEAQKSVPFDDL